MPDSAQHHYQEWQSGPERSAELDRTLELNPRYTAAWIARGLAAEMAGNRKLAEASLRRAAQINRMYLPAWTLANFYLRAGDPAQFWIWARRAAEMAYEPSALFQLLWRVSNDPREIAEKAIPAAPPARRAYLDFLLRTNRLGPAEAAAEDLSRTATAADLDRLLRYCDMALAGNQLGRAREIWGGLQTAGLIGGKAGSTLTNGDLAAPPLGRCFDWRSNEMAGVAVSFDPTSRELLVSLSGKQPQASDLVEQYLVLQPGATYRFGFAHRPHDVPAESGLAWSFVDARGGGEFARIAVDGPAGGWSGQTLEFAAPTDGGLARILLRYHRPVGGARVEGAVEFGRFSLEEAR